MTHKGEGTAWQLEQDWIFGSLDATAQGFIELCQGIGLRLL